VLAAGGCLLGWLVIKPDLQHYGPDFHEAVAMGKTGEVRWMAMRNQDVVNFRYDNLLPIHTAIKANRLDSLRTLVSLVFCLSRIWKVAPFGLA
jgi:hypothetical protein